MSFLAPWFLAGALAVALPVIFHLIRRSSRDRQSFSSLMFLNPTPPRVTRRNRIENVVLLLLRCLALVLLALAFARPLFRTVVPPEPEIASNAAVVILLDTSASMQREGLWEQAVAAATAELRRAGPGDRISLMAYDQRVRQEIGFEEWASMGVGDRVNRALAWLSGLKPGWGASHAGSALTFAAETLADATRQEADNARRRIVLITDLQEGSRLEPLQGYDWPRNIVVSVIPLKVRRGTNAGLQWIASASDTPASSADPGLRVRVSNSSDADREQFEIAWAPPGSSAPVKAYVPPGQSRIVSAPALAAGGGESASLVLTGDDDTFDNTLHTVRQQPRGTRVLFLGEDPERDPAHMLYYLTKGFQETRRQRVELVSRTSAAGLAEADLEDATLVIVSDGVPEPRVPALQLFLDRGGIVLWALKHAASAGSLGRLLDLPDLGAREAEGSGYAMFGEIAFEHPLFAPFADPRFSDFTKIHFWKHRVLDPARIPDARVLARFDNGDPALLEIPRGRGRVILLTSGWQPSDSQLALSSKFVPLLYRLLEQAGGGPATTTQFHVGEEIDPSVWLAGGPARDLVIRKPDGVEIQVAAGTARLTGVDQPGIYEITGLEAPIRFAVNLDFHESRTGPLPVEELERLGVPMKPMTPEPVHQLAQKQRLLDAEVENRQKLWRWLIVLAVVVLLVETGLAGWLTRRPSIRPEVST